MAETTHHDAADDAKRPAEPNPTLPPEPRTRTGDDARAERPDNGVVPPGDGATSRKV